MEAEDFLKYMLNFFQEIDKQVKEIEEELSNKDFDNKLLVENKTICNYKEWFKKINI